MPTLQLKVSQTHRPLPARALGAALTRLAAECLGKRPEVTAVMIEELPASHWTIGGEEVQEPTVFLEISITAGTNTVTEKAAFVAAAFAELQRQLGDGGPLASASYVIVRELPATDWGYGGHTQAQRKLQREATPY